MHARRGPNAECGGRQQTSRRIAIYRWYQNAIMASGLVRLVSGWT